MGPDAMNGEVRPAVGGALRPAPASDVTTVQQ
jgi:hypothetical protein